MANVTSMSIVQLIWSPTKHSWPRRISFAAAGVVAAGVAMIALTQDLHGLGYPGVFVASFTSSASMFIPLPGVAVVAAASVVLTTWVVGLLAGIGGALGEMTGYAVGCASHRLVKQRKVPEWLYRAVQRHMGLTVIAVSIIPNPFVDFVGLIAGRLCYPVGAFLAYTVVGKTVRGVLLAYLFSWGVPALGLGT